MIPGAQYVMTPGLMWMLVLLADSWATPDSVRNTSVSFTLAVYISESQFSACYPYTLLHFNVFIFFTMIKLWLPCCI